MSKLTGLGGRLHRGETSFNIIGNRRRWYAISALVIIASIAALSIQGLKLGIEFKGGAAYSVNKAGISVADAQAAIDAAGISLAIVASVLSGFSTALVSHFNDNKKEQQMVS